VHAAPTVHLSVAIAKTAHASLAAHAPQELDRRDAAQGASDPALNASKGQELDRRDAAQDASDHSLNAAKGLEMGRRDVSQAASMAVGPVARAGIAREDKPTVAVVQVVHAGCGNVARDSETAAAAGGDGNLSLSR